MKQKKPLPKQAIVGVVAVAVLLVGFIGYTLLIKPQKSRLADVKSQIAQVEQTIQLYKQEAAQSKPTATPKIRVADIYRLARAMPSDVDMADIVLELNNVAQSAGVTIDTIGPGGESPGNGFQLLPIHLTVHGDFYALTDFLYRLRTLVDVRHGQLEAAGRLFMVDDLTLAPDSGAGADALQATLDLKTFVYGGGGSTLPSAAAPSTAPADTTATTTTAPSASAEGAP